jgi:hypothetical protein
MEPYLKNIEAWCWRYKENTRNYPGLHFTAKSAACDALFTCLKQLRSEANGPHRTMPLRQLRAEDEAKITGGQRYECFSRLRLGLHEESDRLRQMSFRVEGDAVCFDLAVPCISKFERGLADVRGGTGDYCIEPQGAAAPWRAGPAIGVPLVLALLRPS